MARLTGKKRFVWAVLVFWAALSLLLVLRTLVVWDAAPLLGDGDDAMRLVTATNLLDGQGWQHTVEPRDNTPYGAPMHWSRLIDAPIAILIALARPAFGTQASLVAAIAWPLLLMLPMLLLSTALTRRMVPDGTLAGLALPIVSLAVLIEFLPGRVDHHNVQIILSLGLVLAVLDIDRSRWAAPLAGLAAATSIAIGLETLPLIAVAAAAIGLFWALQPRDRGGSLVTFCVTFALAAFGHFALAVAPSAWLIAACDAISPVYVVAAVLLAIAACGAVWLGSRLSHPLSRLAALAVLGGIALAVTLAIFPQCLRGPYAEVDRDLYDLLFPGIAEAQPVWRRLAEDPAAALAFTLPPILALLSGLVIVRRTTGNLRRDWLLLIAFLAAAVLVMLFQMRGARLAGPLAVPIAAYVIDAMRARYLAHPRLGSALSMLAGWLGFAGVAWYTLALAVLTLGRPAATAAPIATDARQTCFHQSAYAELASLPPSQLIAPIRLGPHLLALTPHSIVSAGFHRNETGIRDAIAFFNASEAEARAIVETRGLDFLVTCEGLPELAGYPDPDPTSFAALYRNGQRWDWLTEISPPGSTLTVYRLGD